ncbi:hypothetical protein P7C70_g8793, partial [Phenoliferia sp. Uapishka_3]
MAKSRSNGKHAVASPESHPQTNSDDNSFASEPAQAPSSSDSASPSSRALTNSGTNTPIRIVNHHHSPLPSEEESEGGGEGVKVGRAEEGNGDAGSGEEREDEGEAQDDEIVGLGEYGRGKRKRRAPGEAAAVKTFGELDGDLESEPEGSASGATSEEEVQKPKKKGRRKSKGGKRGEEGGEEGSELLDANTNYDAECQIQVTWSYWAEEPAKKSGKTVSVPIKGPEGRECWFQQFRIGKCTYQDLVRELTLGVSRVREWEIIAGSLSRRMKLPESDRSALELVGWIKKNRQYPVSRPAQLSVDEERWKWVAAVVAALEEDEKTDIGVTFQALHKANEARDAERRNRILGHEVNGDESGGKSDDESWVHEEKFLTKKKCEAVQAIRERLPKSAIDSMPILPHPTDSKRELFITHEMLTDWATDIAHGQRLPSKDDEDGALISEFVYPSQRPDFHESRFKSKSKKGKASQHSSSSSIQLEDLSALFNSRNLAPSSTPPPSSPLKSLHDQAGRLMYDFLEFCGIADPGPVLQTLINKDISDPGLLHEMKVTTRDLMNDAGLSWGMALAVSKGLKRWHQFKAELRARGDGE